MVIKKSAIKFFLVFGLLVGGSLLRASPCVAFYYTFPSCLTLCGEPVPFADRKVWERMDREFMLNVYDRAQVFLWLKRSKRYFPYVEARLKEKGMPDDLKYLLVAESSLRPQALSNKGAAGFWQFIEKTGKRFSLQKKPWIDERLDLIKSTEAAINYLKILYNQFGKWNLAMAAYNCGEDRVREEISLQGETDYYRMALPQETERYIFRILAVKVILADPKKYGFDLPEKEEYLPIEYDQVMVQLSPCRSPSGYCQGLRILFQRIKRIKSGDSRVYLASRYLPIKNSYREKIPSGKKW